MRSFSRMSITALLGASVLVGLSLLAGCGSSSDNNAAQTNRNQTVPPFIPNGDVQYIDAIVPHHQMALEMAQMELDKGTRADIKALAQSMKDMQTSEIALLKSARQALTGQAEIPTPTTDAHMEKDMADMRAMAAGPMMDEMFLDDMIPHHSEAISLAHRALPSLSRADVKDNATNVISGQAKEIGEMQMLRSGM